MSRQACSSCAPPLNARHIDTSRGTAFTPSDLHRLTSQAPPGALHGQHVAADEASDAESPRRGHTEGLACIAVNVRWGISKEGPPTG